jgi:hypothetical protein
MFSLLLKQGEQMKALVKILAGFFLVANVISCKQRSFGRSHVKDDSDEDLDINKDKLLLRWNMKITENSDQYIGQFDLMSGKTAGYSSMF